jgi:hypothetical protein
MGRADGTADESKERTPTGEMSGICVYGLRAATISSRTGSSFVVGPSTFCAAALDAMRSDARSAARKGGITRRFFMNAE